MDLKGVLEGILFVVGEDGISFEKLKNIMELSDDDLMSLISDLKNDYLNTSHGFNIEILGSKYKLVTKKEHRSFYEKLCSNQKSEYLSQAALETLAIIAYNEPVTRSFIDEIRGVDSSHLIRKLLLKNIIKEVGRSDLPGKPILYGVTSQLLDYLGLSSISDLPKLEISNAVEDNETDLYESKYTE